MIKVVLFVPLLDNHGQPFSSDDWNALEERLASFGGYSVQSSIEGAWVDEGRIYRDRHRAYTVALTTVRRVPAWVDVVEWALVAFRQEALYLEVNGVPEILRR
jgi:hypothetical protein